MKKNLLLVLILFTSLHSSAVIVNNEDVCAEEIKWINIVKEKEKISLDAVLTTDEISVYEREYPTLRYYRKKCQIERDPAVLAEKELKFFEAEKKRTEEIARTVATEERRVAKMNSGIFGMIPGESTLEDLQTLVTVSDAKMCKLVKVVQYCGFEYTEFGYINNLDTYDHKEKKHNISFAKINVDGKYFNSIFLEKILISLELSNQYNETDFSKSFADELKSAFNKKYRKIKTTSEKFSDTLFSASYVYEKWMETSDAYLIELKETKTVVKNPSKCQGYVAALPLTGSRAIKAMAKCNPELNNIPSYTLIYRNEVGYQKAVSVLNELEAQKNSAESSNKNKGLSKF